MHHIPAELQKSEEHKLIQQLNDTNIVRNSFQHRSTFHHTIRRGAHYSLRGPFIAWTEDERALLQCRKHRESWEDFLQRNPTLRNRSAQACISQLAKMKLMQIESCQAMNKG
jgi:hypothetical protein